MRENSNGPTLLIRERAHRLWEQEGRPQGRALDHWLRAERQAQAIRERAYRIWERSGYPSGAHLDHWLHAEADVSRSYLLDTSAFIALGYIDFLRLSNWNLCVSPYVFWERLCHLDERTDFGHAKREFGKLDQVQILDDPRAGIEKPTDHVSDTDVVRKALDALRSASSFDSFYSIEFLDPNGNRRSIQGCVDAVRSELKQREEHYVEFVTSIMRHLQQHQVLSDAERHSCIVDLCLGYKAADVGDCYLYFGYVFHRALRFVNEGQSVPAKPSHNDYEDSRICLHVALQSGYWLVTNDSGTKRALDETRSLLGGLGYPDFRTNVEIKDAQYLRGL